MFGNLLEIYHFLVENLNCLTSTGRCLLKRGGGALHVLEISKPLIQAQPHQMRDPCFAVRGHFVHVLRGLEERLSLGELDQNKEQRYI